MTSIQNLVFQGGGVKGIAYAGAIRVLEQQGVLGGVVNVAGTSAGAITAALLAAGVTADELEGILRSTDFTSFLDGPGWIVRESVRLYERFGIHPGQSFEAWLRTQLGALTERITGRAQPDITFGGLRALAAQYPGRIRDLHVVTTNLVRQLPEVFSADTRPDVPVFRAVRMSMSIPLFFEAVSFEGGVYVDGGVSWNYPIDLFDGAYRKPVLGRPAASGVPSYTLGFSLGTKQEIAAEQHDWQPLPVTIDGLEGYVRALTSFLLETPTLLHLDEAALARTVFIDNAGVGTTDFAISKEQMDRLVENGATATAAWFAARGAAAGNLV